MFIFRKVTDFSERSSDTYTVDISFLDLAKMGELKWYYEDISTIGVEQSVSLEASNWVNKGVTDSGIGSEENNLRLTYTTVLDVPSSKKVGITFDDSEHYQWAIRSGDAEGSYPNNQYWYNSGEILNVTGSGKMIIIIRKVTDNTERSKNIHTVAITTSDAQTSGLKLYYISD